MFVFLPRNEKYKFIEFSSGDTLMKSRKIKSERQTEIKNVMNDISWQIPQHQAQNETKKKKIHNVS